MSNILSEVNISLQGITSQLDIAEVKLNLKVTVKLVNSENTELEETATETIRNEAQRRKRLKKYKSFSDPSDNIKHLNVVSYSGGREGFRGKKYVKKYTLNWESGNSFSNKHKHPY